MKKYYLHNGSSQEGPFDIDELKAQNLTKETHVWHEGLPEWILAGQLDELKQTIKTVPPPFIPKPAAESVPVTPKPISPPPISTVKSTAKPVDKKRKKKNSILKVLFILLVLGVLGIGAIYAYQEVNYQMEQRTKKDGKERIRNNIDLYVTASNNEYSYSKWGGIYGLQITVSNETDYLIDNARVKITYIKANGNVWQAKSFDFSMIKPHSSLTLRIPDTERGTDIQYEITSIKSNALEMY